MRTPEMLAITVAYAGKMAQAVLPINVSPGSTIRAAIERSRILQQFPEIDLAQCRVGIYGQLRAFTDIVTEGDRVEIYRPLAADPKALRVQRSKGGATGPEP